MKKQIERNLLDKLLQEYLSLNKAVTESINTTLKSKPIKNHKELAKTYLAHIVKSRKPLFKCFNKTNTLLGVYNKLLKFNDLKEAVLEELSYTSYFEKNCHRKLK